MSDPLSVAAGIVSLLDPSLRYQLLAFDRNTLSQSYGPTAGFLISTAFPNAASEYERLQRVILRGTDEETLRFRASVTNECNMTAIAGAIIAQVALTALSLADLSRAHWTARAFLLFATVAGCLSVYYACALSKKIGALYQPEQIRGWLSAEREPDQTGQQGTQERKTSISAIFVLSAPYTMMSYSIAAFIVGLAIYQAFVWTRNLDTDAGKINSRNVFIAYIVSSGFGVVFFSSAGWIKYGEDLLLYSQSLMMKRSVPLKSRDGKISSEPEANPSVTSTVEVAAAPQTIYTASHPQDTVHGNPSGGLVAALEAAAKAHILSAEADRQVAKEYARLSKS